MPCNNMTPASLDLERFSTQLPSGPSVPSQASLATTWCTRRSNSVLRSMAVEDFGWGVEYEQIVFKWLQDKWRLYNFENDLVIIIYIIWESFNIRFRIFNNSWYKKTILSIDPIAMSSFQAWKVLNFVHLGYFRTCQDEASVSSKPEPHKDPPPPLKPLKLHYLMQLHSTKLTMSLQTWNVKEVQRWKSLIGGWV